MNAVKELMCGDWVLINNAPHRIQAIDSIDAEVQADDELYYVGEDRCHSEDKIEGIPLTSEILEKNGFVFDGFSFDCGFWTIANPRYNNVRMVSYYPNGDDVADAFLGHWAFDKNYAIDYVHELQRALRLCGLNELADNFKV